MHLGARCGVPCYAKWWSDEVDIIEKVSMTRMSYDPFPFSPICRGDAKIFEVGSGGHRRQTQMEV